MRRLAFVGLFPLTLIAVFGGAIASLERGVGGGVVLGVGSVACILLVILCERLLPFRPEWNHSQGDVRADLAYLPTFMGVNSLVKPGVTALGVGIGVWVSAALDATLWPGGWPLLGQFALACVVVEFFDYWPHRWLHVVPSLWRFHAIHHSPGRLYWLNATRSHPVEMIFRALFSFLPLALLGAGPEVLVLVGLANTCVGLFQHANIDFALGPLAWIFSVGDMHRWHHSENLAEASHNYGSNFLVWDVVFGTWYRPKGRRAPDRLGIEGLEDFPSGWWQQLGEPFRSRWSS